jgi:hypothetical protein
MSTLLDLDACEESFAEGRRERRTDQPAHCSTERSGAPGLETVLLLFVELELQLHSRLCAAFKASYHPIISTVRLCIGASADSHAGQSPFQLHLDSYDSKKAS